MLKTIQGMRAVAALLVLLMHCQATLAVGRTFGSFPFGRIFDGGEMGVDIFFVISGFVLCVAHQSDIGRPERLKRYVLRRFWRIFPAFWIVSCAVIFIKLVLGRSLDLSPGELVSALMLIPIHVFAENILEVAWTLRFELLFYLLIGLMIWNRRVGFGVAAITFAATPILYLSLEPVPGGWPQPSLIVADPRMWEFLLGIAAALILRSGVIKGAWPILMCAAGALCLFAGIILEDMTPIELGYGSYKLTFPEWERVLFAGSGGFLLVCGLSLGEMAGRFRTPRFLEYLGETSYSLYLIHLPVVTVVAQLWLHFHLREWLPDSGAYISMVIVALILSCAFFELVEKPIIAFGRRRRET